MRSSLVCLVKENWFKDPPTKEKKGKSRVTGYELSMSRGLQ